MLRIALQESERFDDPPRYARLVSLPNHDGQKKSIPVGTLDQYAYQHPSDKDPIMNAHSSQLSVLLSRPLSERVVSEVGKALRGAGAVLALWRNHRARNRDARAVDAMTDMNEHMLRDIGAPDRLISHAAARSDADQRRRIPVQLLAPLVVIALAATVALGATAEAADLRPAGKASATAQVDGVFTGEYVNGAPVYRLPPVLVVARRDVDTARLERGKQLTRAEQARAKAAARPPA
jgi:uncharacterized protein YjiS (DUF1127 family)